MKKIFALLLIVVLGACKQTKSENKSADPVETAKAFKGEFVYYADTAIFRDCENDSIYPVTGEEEYVKLERAYLEADHEDMEPEWVVLEGEIKLLRNMEGPEKPTIVISRFISLDDEKKCDE